ncbi:PAS domain-containing protein [Halosquirtibacter laminarini]|uniref:PAS domain-containing protein n=1 Tax=Halosquirtibacter laminarini TaxID=3374600 RepID=A0AC61NKU5_9BACT|nr:PAS domain-containing protein [Prolixibacteraceae bacterium]
MKEYMDLDMDKISKILEIKRQIFDGELTKEEAKALVSRTFDVIKPEEFAYTEQQISLKGISDELMTDEMDDIIDVFRDVLDPTRSKFPSGHPIRCYELEIEALYALADEMEKHASRKFVKNQWLELYEKLSEINTHFSRKQNQLFSILEQKDFDRPSKIMWTFDNNVRDAIKEAFGLLRADKDVLFLEKQAHVIELVRDILSKEEDVLLPTAARLLTEEEFEKMKSGDDEIGYCLIDAPVRVIQTEDKPEVSSDLLSDLFGVLKKHEMLPKQVSGSEEMDVSMGKLTLNQINLIFKHLPIDLSYVDEHDIVKFYSDTKHRVFPRSAGVIGREVQNCHPRESVETVEQIIAEFRAGRQDEAEFWLQMGDKFIYIIYNAVRDDQGNFRGVLEMMQDATHIRSLEGSQKLLSWNKNEVQEDSKPKEKNDSERSTDRIITKEMIIAPLLKKYPFLKSYLISLSEKYKKLDNPVVFNTMGNIATIEMIAGRGGFETDKLIDLLEKRVLEEK